MGSIIIPDDHIAITSSNVIRDIAQPLFSFFNLQEFNFCRFYHSEANQKIIAPLYTNTELLKAAGETTKNLHSQKLLTSTEEIYSLHDMVNSIQDKPSKTIFENLLSMQHEQFNCGPELHFHRYHSHFSDMFDFVAKKNDHQAMNRFINNIDLLESFILYFYDKAEKILKECWHQRITRSVNQLIIPESTKNHQIDKQEFLKTCSINKVNFSNIKNQNMHLTKSEIICANMLIQGKTAKGIASHLDLSQRTIEGRINELKIKTGCSNKSELIEFLIELNLPKSGVV